MTDPNTTAPENTENQENKDGEPTENKTGEGDGEGNADNASGGDAQ